jgi:aspartate carbamoyltransferase catalytic subunit
MQGDLRASHGLASGDIMASLFFEPSTRTRGSFEAAMKRMGGQTITTADIRASSMEKGESLADTIRVWSGYADLIVLRHPWEGAARLAADYGQVPVINAGDGGHEHPTQTLCDLFTLRAEHGTLDGLRVALCGDLKHGRTVHSLIFALLRFGTQMIFMPGEGLELPDHIRHKMNTVYGVPIERVRGEELDLGGLFNGDDSLAQDGGFLSAIYMTPDRPHQLAMHQEGAYVKFAEKGRPIALYITRRQKERSPGNIPGAYPRVSARAMRGPSLSKAIVMHPLPRVDELSTDMDADPRSRYFDQARNGVPVRMALLSLLLGKKPWSAGRGQQGLRRPGPPQVALLDGLKCQNPDCVTRREPQSCDGEVLVYPRPTLWFLCKYCERRITPTHFAYKGRKQFHPVEELRFDSLGQLSRVWFFLSLEEALGAGLVASPGTSRGPKVVEVEG